MGVGMPSLAVENVCDYSTDVARLECAQDLGVVSLNLCIESSL